MRHFYSSAKKCGCEPKETETMSVTAMTVLILLLAQATLAQVTLAQVTLAQTQTGVGPVVGSTIKDFTLSDQHGVSKKLSERISDSAMALVVVKSVGWCSQSKAHLSDLQQESENFAEAGLKIACLSYDSVEVLNSFATEKGITFPMLADPQSAVIRQLGLLNTKFKKDTLRYGLAHPTTILIDRAGNVVNVTAGFQDPIRLLKLWESRKPNVTAQGPRLDYITVKGNKFVNQNDSQMIFRGVAIADPYKIVEDEQWNRKHFYAIKKWGANIVRIPVHPESYRSLGEEAYFKLLDQAVHWCEEYEMYVILDWHSIGNLKAEKFESDGQATNFKETQSFWDHASKRYCGNPTIAFYELFNEPSVNFGKYGDCTWAQWKLIVEQIIDTIRANDKRTIPLVAGFDWAYDLQDAGRAPISRENIAYVTHPYPGKSEPPREAHWEEHFGFLAKRFPIFATETGFYHQGEDEHFVDADGSFRGGILKYLDQKQISWCAWVFDPDFSPALIKGYDYVPTKSGVFFKNALLTTTKAND